MKFSGVIFMVVKVGFVMEHLMDPLATMMKTQLGKANESRTGQIYTNKHLETSAQELFAYIDIDKAIPYSPSGPVTYSS